MNEVLVGFIKTLVHYGKIEFFKDSETEQGYITSRIVTFEDETYLIVMTNGIVERIEKLS